MNRFYFLFAVLVGVALASCSGDELSDPSPTPIVETEPEIPIMFGSLSKGFTRGDYTGVDAAKLLGNKFVVSAKKGSSTGSTGAVTFDNYLVEYVENTAHTTETNVANWEYVGKPRTQHAIDHGITSQTIKYWDYSAPQYDFIAWSTGTKTAIYDIPYSGVPEGKIYVSAIKPNSTSSETYSLTGSAADLSECYIADIVTVKKGQYGSNPVTMVFRRLGIKVRIGIYETIPGYSVKNVKFYTKGDILSKDGDGNLAAGQIINDAAVFTANPDVYTSGTYFVNFPTVDNPTSADNNQAHVTFVTDGPQSTVVKWGGLNYTTREEGEKSYGDVYLGRTSSTASFAGDATDKFYTVFMPNEAGTNLNLRVDYTLEAIDGSGEEIQVKSARAQIPSVYTTWKPGFAYTYLFKISDKTNGRTGVYDPTKYDNDEYNSDPAGLYPITFDAVVVNEEDQEQRQENITTVMTPSITTYQQNSTVINSNEYTDNGSDIFVTVDDSYGNLQTLTGKAALYRIPDGKTEAEVVDALQIRDDYPAEGTIKGRNGMVLTAATKVATAGDINAANKYALTNSVEFGVDGNAIPVSTDQSLRFRPAPNTTYAFVYTHQAPTSYGYTDKFETVTKHAGEDVTNLYRNFNLTAATGDAYYGWIYMSMSPTGVLTQETPFVGHHLGNNIYVISSGSGTDEDPYVYTKPWGYAQTGTTYYYSTDDGATFNATVNMAYADFAEATDLYTYDYVNNKYTAKTDTNPVSGKAYYKRTGAGTDESPYVYTYCIILPQQVDGWYYYEFFAPGRYACFNGEKAISGHGYFDKYTVNDGEYYTKIIKVQ